MHGTRMSVGDRYQFTVEVHPNAAFTTLPRFYQAAFGTQITADYHRGVEELMRDRNKTLPAAGSPGKRLFFATINTLLVPFLRLMYPGLLLLNGLRKS